MANVRRSGYWRATLVATAMIVLSACNPSRFVSGWVPYWNATQGRAAFTDSDATKMFKDVLPFFFTAKSDATIEVVGSQSALTTTIHEAHTRGLTVLPSITDGSGRLTMATVILPDPNLRALHIANIVGLTVQYPEIDGVDLDYEGFAFADGRDNNQWESTRAVWRSFVAELAAALHAKGKLLSITIPPTWLVGQDVTGYTLYDEPFVAAVADRLNLMVYDYSVSSPGPISPMSWVRQVIAYVDAALPDYKSKVQLGVPAYGRDWGRAPGQTCPDGALDTHSIELENMPALAKAHLAVPTRHVESGEMTFSYDVVETGYSSEPIPAPPYVPSTGPFPKAVGPATPTGLQPALRLTPPAVLLTCTVHHYVYYPDATAIQQHAQAALDAGWSGVVLWALGYETPEVYVALGNTTP